MATGIFQTTVLKKQIDFRAVEIEAAYEVFAKYFRNENVQKKIREHKEEEYKPEFIRKLFVDVLGYTPSFDPTDDFNLRIEQKNEDDQKKADVAILVNDDVRAVIEIKDTRTINMGGRIQEQAFGYKNHHKNALYVITSNFEKVRFYIDYAGEYMEWNLFTLNRENFGSLWVCLAWNSIKSDVPKRLKTESFIREEEITRDFYEHYKRFKDDIFADLITRNPDKDKLTLFTAAQKILDRVLFMRFAEDRGMLPPNMVAQYVLEDWQTIQLTFDNEYRLYDLLKKNFGHLNRGHTDKRRAIYGYNGGLFKTDEILDNLTVSDEVLRNLLWGLCQYDFNSDVDVNILGHIFEHSLTEIEKIKNELIHPSERPSPKEGKRKKEGIFYTPNFVTKYIVEQTLGKLCNEKKQALGINDDWLNEAIQTKSKKKKALAEALDDKRILPLNQYREYLLSLTICDPACGSGAFLNAAFDFLIAEHHAIDEMIGKILEMKSADISVGIESEILRNNLFGVDVNEEGVEITRLALWLHSAKRDTKLCFLDDNIKCGNSLVSDPAVAGAKAFDWHKEFPQVFKQSQEPGTEHSAVPGFDVVIGNPPYFNIQTLGAGNPQAQWIQNTYSDIWQDKSDILFYFVYKALEISKSEVGVIVSNAFLFSDKATKLRNHLLKDGRLAKIVNFEQFMVFPDASITTGIVIFNKSHDGIKAIVLKEKDYDVDVLEKIIRNEENEFSVELKENDVFALVSQTIIELNEKIDGRHPKLGEICLVGKGMEIAANEVFLFEVSPKHFPKKHIKRRLVGENISRYSLAEPPRYLLYVEEVDEFEKLPTLIQKHLLSHKAALSNRATVRNEGRLWWKYSRPMHKELYHLSKIWCSYRSKDHAFILDETSDYIGLTNTTAVFDTNDEYSLKYILALLNSKLLAFRYKSIGKQTGGGVFEYVPNGVSKLPIPKISKAQQRPFIALADKMLSLHTKLRTEWKNFLEMLTEKYVHARITGKLERFGDLEFKDVLAELTKQKINVLPREQYDWKKIFQKSRSIRERIRELDDAIDRMVFALYGLTDEEIALVELQTEPDA